MKSPYVAIIIPTYNEAQNIVKLINTVHKVCKNISHEIIVVDDQSPDGTADLIIQTFARIPWVTCLVRKGVRSLGASIIYGIHRAQSKIIIGMDADFNHDPDVIPTLVDALEHADLVVASRFVSGGGMADKTRFVASFIFNWILKTFLGFPIWDNTSGFYATTRKTLQLLKPTSIYKGYGEYHLRLVWAAQKLGLTMKEVPVYYHKRIGGASKSHLFTMAYTYFLTALDLRKRA